jgi:hypothetical protein
VIPQWDEYRNGVRDRRFLLPLNKFAFTVRYVTVIPDQGQLRLAGSLIADSVVTALCDPSLSSGCSLSALRLLPGEAGASKSAESDDDGETSFFSVVFADPVYDFTIQMGPTTFQIVKSRSPLEHVVKTFPVLSKICSLIFQGTEDPSGEPQGAPDVRSPRPSLQDILGIQNRVHGFGFMFGLQLRLGTHVTDPSSEARNNELVEKLIRTDCHEHGDSARRRAPFLTMLPGELVRGDIKFCIERAFGDRPRGIWLDFKGPWNISRKDVDLILSFQNRQSGAHLEMADLLDWETPILAFYRDLMLNQLMPSLFYDIMVEPRLA